MSPWFPSRCSTLRSTGAVYRPLAGTSPTRVELAVGLAHATTTARCSRARSTSSVATSVPADPDPSPPARVTSNVVASGSAVESPPTHTSKVEASMTQSRAAAFQ